MVDIYFTKELFWQISRIFLFRSFSLSLSFFYLRAHTYPIRGAKLINTGHAPLSISISSRSCVKTGRELEFPEHETRPPIEIQYLDWARFDPLFLRVLRARSITDCTDRTCVTCDQRNVHLSKPIVVRFWPGMQRTGLNLIRIMLVVNVTPLEHRLSIVFSFFIYRFDRKNGGFSNSFFFSPQIIFRKYRRLFNLSIKKRIQH